MREKQRQHEMPHAEYKQMYADRMGKVFDLYSREGLDVRLVGSLGRAATLSTVPQTFRGEYGKLKDLDLVVCNDSDEQYAKSVTQEAQRLAGEVPLEVLSSQDKFGFTTENAEIRYRDLRYSVDPQVFAPNEATLLGNTIPTFDPNTLIHMSVLYGKLSPKTTANLRQYMQDIKDTRTDMLPEGLFKPFHQLGGDKWKEYPWDEKKENIRMYYYRKVPEKVRGAILPVTATVFNAVRG